jgi:hypothetical protein
MRCDAVGKRAAGAALALGLVGGLALLAAAGEASASIVTLTVIPGTGTGLVEGGVCSTSSGQTCPTDATFAMTGTEPVSGDFQYNSSTGTASFSLTLTSNATFGTETLAAGSTFSGSGIGVTASALGSETEINENVGPYYGTQNLTFSGPAGLTQSAGGGAPSVTALNCIIGATVDSCTVQLGPAGTALQDSSSNAYDSFLQFKVNASAVPLPAALWNFLGAVLLVAGGLGLQSHARAFGRAAA